MIKTTYSEAIERCRKEGGRFRNSQNDTPKAWVIVLHDGRVVSEDGGIHLNIWAQDFTEEYVYEPPKQSAFEKWNSQRPVAQQVDYRDIIRERKNGWNGALDELLKHPARIEGYGYIEPRYYSEDKIKELKE